MCIFFVSYTQGQGHTDKGEHHESHEHHNHTYTLESAKGSNDKDSLKTLVNTGSQANNNSDNSDNLTDSIHSTDSTQNLSIRPKLTKFDGILLHDWLQKNHRANSPWHSKQKCPIGADSPFECMRRTPNMAFMDKGVPGVKNTLLSLETLRPMTYQSFFNPVVKNALHSNGGLILPKSWEPVPYNDHAIREAWSVPGIQDTPSTQMQWERGPFEMNVFHLKVERLLSKRAYLVLDLFTESSNSEKYDYTAVVHQPYLSNASNLNLASIWKSFDRDSSNIVLEGVSQGTESFHFRPRIGWILSPQSVLETYWDYSSNSSQGIAPLGDTLVIGPIIERLQKPFLSHFSSQSLGAMYRYQREYSKLSLGTQWGSYNKNSAAHTHQNHSTTFDLTNGPTQSFEGSVWKQFLEVEQGFEFWYRDFTLDFTLLGGLHNHIEEVTGPLFITTTLDSSYVTKLKQGIDITLGQRDEQIIYGGLQWQWEKHFYGKLVGQGHRISFMDNTRAWVAGYNASLQWNVWKQPSLHNLYVLGGVSRVPSVPHWEQLYVDNSLVFQTPNPGQHAGALEKAHIKLGGGTSWIQGFVSWNRLFGTNTLEREVLPDSLGSTNTLENALGYKQYNATLSSTLALGLHLGLGEWDVAVSYSHLLNNRFQLEKDGKVIENKELPNAVYKGYIQWQKPLIGDRMLLTLQVDWERFGERLSWQPQWDGTAKVVNLEEFWVVDFQAQAKIQSFVLYYKIKNLNHDRYYIAPGDHPPGIQFRWGINWSLDG